MNSIKKQNKLRPLIAAISGVLLAGFATGASAKATVTYTAAQATLQNSDSTNKIASTVVTLGTAPANMVAPSVSANVTFAATRASQSGLESTTLSLQNTEKTNTATGSTETLDASFGSATGSSAITTSGTVSHLGAQSTSANDLTVSLSTAAAGSFTKTATLNVSSDAAGTTGESATTNIKAHATTPNALTQQTVTVTGAVYQTASAQNNTSIIDFGNVHVNSTVAAQNVNVRNTATGAAGYVDSLVGGKASSNNNAFTASSTGTSVASGSNGNVASVSFNDAVAGSYSGQAIVNLSSHDSAIATDAIVAPVTVNVSGAVYNYANATLTGNGITGGNVLTGSAAAAATPVIDTISLNLGSFKQGSVANETLTLANSGDSSTSFTDLLNSSQFQNFASNSGFSTKFSDFTSLAAGKNETFSITLDTSRKGTFTGDMIITLNGTDPGYSGMVGKYDIQVSGIVTAVPEAEEWAMMVVGLGLIGVRLSRKSQDDQSIAITA